MWQDIAFIIRELTCIHPVTNQDLSSMVKIMDVGCAHGFLIRHLRSRGIESWGCDNSAYALEHAPDDVKPHLTKSNLTLPNSIPLHPRNGYNVVTCFETLEHIPEDSVDAAIENMASVMNPQGLLIATICVLGHPDPYSDPTHITIKDPHWWEHKFADHNLERVDFMEEDLKRFHLFKSHLGVFALRRSSG
jgi:cyclopropane fatty-acyl-phospholipid synthase-like methyltransferase